MSEESSEKTVYGGAASTIETFLDECSKLVKYLILPVSLCVAVVLLSSTKFMSEYVTYAQLFLAGWVGILVSLIYSVFSFKIDAADISTLTKYFLRISLILVGIILFLTSLGIALEKVI